MAEVLKRVNLSTDVYFICLNHAMCTEAEEIVGLLVGEVDKEGVADVVAVIILRRSDRKKDRVEIAPEQLSNASTEADKLACILKRPLRVIGWYHSHPKLAVYPSMVDVHTQDCYQRMDRTFIGLIFSVYNPDPNKFGGRVQMICYQSHKAQGELIERNHLEIPVYLEPSPYISSICVNTLIELPYHFCQEEQLSYSNVVENRQELDYLTKLNNSAVFLKKMSEIAEVLYGPLLKMLEERIYNNEIKRKRLQEKKKALTAQIEKVKRENAKRKQCREEAKLKKRIVTEQTCFEELERIELSEVEKQITENLQFKEKDAILKMNQQGVTFSHQSAEQLVIPPKGHEQMLFMSEDNENVEMILPDQKTPELDRSNGEVMGQQVYFEDLAIPSTSNVKEQNMHIGQLTEEHIMVEEYVSDHDILEFYKLQEKELEKAIAVQSGSEEKLTNVQFQIERGHSNAWRQSHQNFQDEYQTIHSIMSNIVDVNVRNFMDFEKRERENELSASPSFSYDNLVPVVSVPIDVVEDSSEFMQSVESFNVADVIMKPESQSDISKCNIEDEPKAVNQEQSSQSNSGQKFGEKTSLPVMNIAMPPAMEESGSKIIKKPTVHEEKH